jgi:hypothetical protein
MRLHDSILCFAVLPMMAQTQLFTFGVKGGVPAQTPLGQTDNRMPFVIGPTVNVRIFSRLSLETGVLFHRMGQRSDNGVFQYPENAVTLTSSTERGRALELPFLVKYHFLGEHRTWRPFVTAGPTVRRTSLDESRSASILSSPQLVNFAPQLSSAKTAKWTVDPAVGAGVDLRAGRFHLEPEVRYSYWGCRQELRGAEESSRFSARLPVLSRTLRTREAAYPRAPLSPPVSPRSPRTAPALHVGVWAAPV